MPISLDLSTIHRLENTAADRFHQFYARRHIKPELPLPLETLVHTDLGLDLRFSDLGAIVGGVPSLGMLCLEQRLLVIDNSLDPFDHPELRGRYRFTVAHEIAHFCLHCRDKDVTAGWLARDPAREIVREREADFFAAALLEAGQTTDRLRPEGSP